MNHPLKFFTLVIAFFLSNTIHAQINITVNVLPPWAPYGYTEQEYYYLPDIEVYYDTRTAVFIYYENNVWVRRTYLPARHKNYDLYHGYKVVLTDYHGSSPYDHFKEHKVSYYKGYKGKAQKNIGEKPGKGSANEGNSMKSNKHGKGNGKGKKG
ncbi:MAG: hypothetical protein NT150_12880 [Bacteroidetes bacterium]|nr:hypothetical protein [Bacteroidota bacterium]